MRAEPINILLVEDNPDHIILIKEGLGRGGLLNEICVVTDGQEALDYMYHRGKSADEISAPKPGLILLDLKLPKVDSVEM